MLVLEASGKAGGRCRSYHDDRLGRRIDNGNHLILTANRAVLDWAVRIGGDGALHAMPEAAFPFLDLADGARWTVSLGAKPLDLLRKSARPPGVSLADMLRQGALLMTARRGRSVADALPGRGALWHGFWDPMTRAILNEPPETGDARLLRAVMLRSFARGAAACRPVLAPDGLGTALIDPALDLLGRRGVTIRYRSPLRDISKDGDRITALHLRDDRIDLGPRDAAILALPPQALAQLLPGIDVPPPGRSIVNAHFVAPDSGLPPILATLNAATQWIFRRGDVVSVTVSAAEDSPVGELDRDAALALLWSEVAQAIGAHGATVPPAMPAARFLRERAATFDQSPAGSARRSPPRTRWGNLVLAGDHTATGLPATLEGAVLSGLAAARLV